MFSFIYANKMFLILWVTNRNISKNYTKLHSNSIVSQKMLTLIIQVKELKKFQLLYFQN